jgi:NhaC family Na+:H+ antiporter
LATTFVACDQVVAIMLTRQLCDGVEHGGEGLALDLENSAVVVPALVPWSTSCVGIVAFVGMPTSSIACAFLPLFIPLWTLATSLWMQRHADFVDTPAGRLQGFNAEDDVRRWVAAA